MSVEEIRLSLISVRAALCLIYWKYTFLFFKPTSLSFACRKGHKLSLILSRVASSSRIKTEINARKACRSTESLNQLFATEANLVSRASLPPFFGAGGKKRYPGDKVALSSQ